MIPPAAPDIDPPAASSSSTPPGEVELAWRAWPARRRPGRGVLALLVVAGAVWGTWSWTEDAWLTMLAAAVPLAATSSFFVPTSYRLNRDGVEIARPWRSGRRSWDSFRAVRRGREMIVLSPFERPSWLDSFRGEALFLEGGPKEVLEYVEGMVGKGSGSEGG